METTTRRCGAKHPTEDGVTCDRHAGHPPIRPTWSGGESIDHQARVDEGSFGSFLGWDESDEPCPATSGGVQCAANLGHGLIVDQDGGTWDHADHVSGGAWWNEDEPKLASPFAGLISHLRTVMPAREPTPEPIATTTVGGFTLQIVRTLINGKRGTVFIVSYPIESSYAAQRVATDWAAFEARSGIDVMVAFGAKPEIRS